MCPHVSDTELANRAFRAQRTTTSLPPFRAIYVIGAETGAGDPVHIFDHASGTWLAGPPLQTARVNSRGVLTSNRMLYVIGGNDAFDHVYGMVDALTLPPVPARPTSTPTPSPIPVATPTATNTPVPTATATATATPVLTATATKPPAKKTCPKNSVKKHGKCTCKKGYHKAHGKCVKTKHK